MGRGHLIRRGARMASSGYESPNAHELYLAFFFVCLLYLCPPSVVLVVHRLAG